MRFSTITAALFVAVVNAAVLVDRADYKGDKKWSGKGKFEGTFGGDSIDVECDPVSILSTLKDKCNDHICEDNWEVECGEGAHGAINRDPLKVKVTARGQYNKRLRSALIDGIIASISYDAKVVERWVDKRMNKNGGCRTSGCT